MLICVDDIKDHGLSIEFEEKPENFPILEDITKTGECDFHSPLKFQVHAIRIKAMVEVEGRFETKVHLTCRRCLDEFEIPLAANFALTYTQEQPEATTTTVGEGREITAEEAGLIIFSGREIDLREALQEQVVLSIPMWPLCSGACKGLCSKCGANLNDGDCGCRKNSVNIKFAALKNLKLNKKE